MDSSKIPRFDSQDAFPGSFKYTPLEALRNLFVGFVQGLFNAAPPGEYHWDPDPAVSDIVIQDEAPVKEEMMQKRPLIMFVRGPIQFYSFGMDDLLQYDATTGRKTKSILATGTMTVNCCSRVALEAENIGWVTAEHVWLLRDLLMQHGLFDTGRQIQLGSPSPAGSIISDDNGDGWIAVPISVPFHFVRTSSFTPLGKQIVKSIETHVSTRIPKLHSTGSPPFAGFERPLMVTRVPAPPLIPAPDVQGATSTISGKEYYLPKQRHPLDPSREVIVRSVRQNRPGAQPSIAFRAPPFSY